MFALLFDKFVGLHDFLDQLLIIASGHLNQTFKNLNLLLQQRLILLQPLHFSVHLFHLRWSELFGQIQTLRKPNATSIYFCKQTEHSSSFISL